MIVDATNNNGMVIWYCLTGYCFYDIRVCVRFNVFIYLCICVQNVRMCTELIVELNLVAVVGIVVDLLETFTIITFTII